MTGPMVEFRAMVRWMLALTAICASSALIGLGQVAEVTLTTSGLCLTIFAFSAVLLIGSFEAYETQAVRVERDER